MGNRLDSRTIRCTIACDKDHNIVSYRLLQSVLEYQTAVMRRDFDAADAILKTIPESQFPRIAHFLEKQVR